MRDCVGSFLKDESGATGIEYGLIALLLCTAIAVGAGTLGNGLGQFFLSLGTKAQNGFQS